MSDKHFAAELHLARGCNKQCIKYTECTHSVCRPEQRRVLCSHTAILNIHIRLLICRDMKIKSAWNEYNGAGLLVRVSVCVCKLCSVLSVISDPQ